MGHEERFPPPKLNAGCGLRKETIPGRRRNGQVAPKAVIGATPIEPSSALIVRSKALRRLEFPAPASFGWEEVDAPVAGTSAGYAHFRQSRLNPLSPSYHTWTYSTNA